MSVYSKTIGLEITTSKYNGLYVKDSAGNDITDFTHTIYDANNNAIGSAVTEALAVKTVIDFEPQYTYEFIKGSFSFSAALGSDIRCWMVAVPDVDVSNGGSIESFQCINLKYISSGATWSQEIVRGNEMAYNATYHTNKIRGIFKYSVGLQKSFVITLQLVVF